VNRAIRILAALGLLALAVYAALVYGFLVDAFTPFQSAVPALLFMRLFGEAGFVLTLAAGVVAIVACFQRRQRWWAILLVILAVTPFAFYLVYPFLPLLGVRLYLPLLAPLTDPGVNRNAPAALLALIVLVYSFIDSRAATTAQQAPWREVRP
jgi:hypothetical protein